MENIEASPITVSSFEKHYIVFIDKGAVTQEWLLQKLNALRLEILGKQVAFDSSIGEIGERIKAEWWKKNKAKFLDPDRQVENLIDKAGFDETVEQIGEDIKRDWWEKNKD